MNLTIAYITARKEPMLEWFLDSLRREIGDGPIPRLVIVDFHRVFSNFPYAMGYAGTVVHVPPKPCVWQGPHRLTKQDYFAASNSRNTALCLAPDGYLVYVDDLSVLLPGWLNSVKEAMAGGYIVCGAYRKVTNLVVENGEVKSFGDGSENDNRSPQGLDVRLAQVTQDLSPCTGGWLFGCSVGAPVETWLAVNGWPEDLCDGLGSEDCCMGVVLQNAGFELKYDRRMMTYESDEHHHIGPLLKKDDWHFENGKPVRGGNGGEDKSHAALNIALQSKEFPNHCDMRVLRELVLAGNPFPVDLNPQHDWFTHLPLKEL